MSTNNGMNHKNEIEKSKEEIKQLENENMKLKEEQKKTFQNYSASRESEISLNKIKKEPEDNKQKERDILKNNVLSKYNIPLIRLTTNASREENIIRSKLDRIVNNK